MKKILLLLIFLNTFAFCALEPIAVFNISDSLATNYFFSAIFGVLLIAIPSKIALQIIWNYAKSIK
ncbi:hypothetical protein [Sulfurimonas sp.]|uniref:hypothetical protein n=1 Tax=Sulfurimonas sp. TaxID=2022749 RepID=UPI0025F252C7|nr:hypothetical protein [Sulfurimonas sp.]